MPGFARIEVKTFFEREEAYATREGIVHPLQDPRILKFIQSQADHTWRVLEVGGGSGYLLDLLLEADGPQRVYNCELAWKAYKEQAHPRIRLIGGDVLNLPLQGKSLDVLIMKNVLHHLVGATPGEWKALAEHAVAECSRVLRDDGYLMIVEQYNQSGVCSRMLFWVTWILSRLGIGLKRLGLGKGVIVSFLTPQELEGMVAAKRMEAIHTEREIIAVRPIYRATILMGKIGRMLMIAQAQGGAWASLLAEPPASRNVPAPTEHGHV